VNELRYAPFETSIDRQLDKLRADMRTGFARLEAKVDSQRLSPWHSLELTLEGFERRMTKRFFWYFMTQGIANAVIILGGLKLFKLVP
jgi:hypothetical protein